MEALQDCEGLFCFEYYQAVVNNRIQKVSYRTKVLQSLRNWEAVDSFRAGC